MKPNPQSVALCGLLATSGLLSAAQIDVFNDSALSEFSVATPGGYGTNIRVLKADQTWTKDNAYILSDRVFIPSGVTLTIEAGTKIYGSFAENGAGKADDSVGSLIACRGGRIVAVGTAEEPIVFTSIRELEAAMGMDLPYDDDAVAGPQPGPGDAGHWGGVVMLGNSFASRVDASGVNAGTGQVEGFIPAGSYSGDGDSIPDATQYGVSSGFPLDTADDSGELRYVSIRHGGYEFATGSEINGLTLGAVGSGTKLSYIEVYANQDDGVEFFGGTCSTDHMVMAFNQDDSFDIDEGFKGTHQFWFCIQNPGAADAGGEWDGVGGSSAGFNLGDVPNNWSKPIIYNATFIGAGRTNTLSKLPDTSAQVNWEKGNHAIHVEDYFNGEIYNSVFDDFADDFVKFIDNDKSTGTTPMAANNVIGRFGGGTSGDNLSYVTGTNTYDLFFDGFGDPKDGNTDAGTDPMFETYTRTSTTAGTFLTAINPLPAAGSPMLTGPVSAGAPVAANYRGAFGAENWAAGWSKISEFMCPQVDVFNDSTLTEFSTATPGGYGTNIRVLKASQTWTKDKCYILSDRVFIPNGVTLTIEAGTKIYGSFAENGAGKADDSVGSLIACRGGRIVAVGTAEEPIVFTSIRELEAAMGMDLPYDDDAVAGPQPGPGDAGHWGGVVMLGNSFASRVDASGVNAGTGQVEGFIPAGSYSGDGDSIPDATQYGVSSGFPLDTADDSGELRYVSIRHGGYEFATGSEINGLTLGAVGSGTKLSYIEVYANQDDGVEFFGGTCSTDHMVMAFNQDDSFDIDEGFKGTHQFWFCIQNPGAADAGGEWDGVGGSSAGFNLGDVPNNWSKPIIYNATFIGAGRTNTLSKLPLTTGQVQWEKGNHAVHVEDYFNGEIYNSVFDDFADDFVKFIDNDKSTGTTPVAANNVIGRFGGGTPGDNLSYVTGTNTYDLFFDGFGDPKDGNTDAGTDPMFETYTRTSTTAGTFLTAINPLPAAGSPMLAGPVSAGAPVAANYRGAFGTENWAAGWSKLSQAGVLQGAAPVVTDTDGDGLSDAEEGILGTNPNLKDTDGDGVDDGVEVTFSTRGFDPLVADASTVLGSLYTEAGILDLVTGNQVMIQGGGNGESVTLSLPLFRANDLSMPFVPAPALEATFTGSGEAEFYRIEVPSAE